MFRPFLLLTGLSAHSASADITVTFGDGNPWDSFTITTDTCAISGATMTIDLTTSVAGVLIDTEYGGRGTQDPMPAELHEGLATLLPVTDGDQQLILLIATLDRDNPIVLKMDVDDTERGRFGPEIHVAQNEVAGATAVLQVADDQTVGTFANDGVAKVPLPAAVANCLFIG